MALIRADLEHSAALWGMSPMRAIPRAAVKVLLYPRVRAVVMFRLAHAAWARPRLRALALLLQNSTARSSGAELHPAARIGPGLNLVHANGVVIGDKARIGTNARIYQQVTIGDDGRRDGQPVIGDTVVLGAGCKVLGPVSIGDNVTVGANAVVIGNVPDNALAVGIPAKPRPNVHRPG